MHTAFRCVRALRRAAPLCVALAFSSSATTPSKRENVAYSAGLPEPQAAVTWGTDFHSYIQREERLFPKVLDLHGHRLTRLTAGATATVGVEKDGSLLLFKDLQSPPEVLSIAGSTVVQAVDTLDTLWALTAEGKLYRWQKVNGEFPAEPEEVHVPGHVRLFDASSTQVIASTTDNKTYAWGKNNKGQLGVGITTREIRSPMEILGLQGIRLTKISCGGEHTLFLDDVGRAYSCGANEVSQLGLHSEESTVNVPKRVTQFDGHRVVDIAAGGHHSLFAVLHRIEDNEADERFSVWACGSDKFGQLGHATQHLRSDLQVVDGMANVTAEHHEIIGGEIRSWVRKISGRPPAPPTSHVLVGAGDNHSAAYLCNDQGCSVYTWGHNLGAQCGNTRMRFLRTPMPAQVHKSVYKIHSLHCAYDRCAILGSVKFQAAKGEDPLVQYIK